MKNSTVFVQTNSIQAIKSYFKERLSNQFSENEIKFMLKEAVLQRLNMSASDYLMCDTQRLSESDLLYLRSIVKRLQANEPFQYILGNTEFYGLQIKTDKRALIPRPETEELVDWILEDFKSIPVDQFIDFCTGSGCIALALKSKLLSSKGIATDYSQEALNLTTENVELLNLPILVVFHNALSKESVDTCMVNSCDFIVSNPPYIPVADKDEMHANVLDYEPHLALFVDDSNALLFYKAIGEHALNLLKPNASIYFEIHERLGESTSALLKELGFVNIELRKDLQGKDRMLKAQKS